ncbi:MAG: indole-3-glycerol-phosphate synthase, partial [Bacteroidales bacterium]|nr:indole-3-glycerol-phosphate synthase [Bacteroidales bacterium]
LSEKIKQSVFPAFITEFKRKSPSKPEINLGANIDKQIQIYDNAGASAISVLTDTQYFGGSFNDLKLARANTDLPILCKDFIVSPIQIYEAKANGADIILLIASALSIVDVVKLAKTAKELDLDILLEIHNQKELCYIDIQPDLVGINSRNLKTFEVDLQKSTELVKQVPPQIPCIAESGIKSPEDAAMLYAEGFHGFLIGEIFMKAENPEEFTMKFIQKTNELCLLRSAD